jgi:hypothetical protein
MNIIKPERLRMFEITYSARIEYLSGFPCTKYKASSIVIEGSYYYEGRTVSSLAPDDLLFATFCLLIIC